MLVLLLKELPVPIEQLLGDSQSQSGRCWERYHLPLPGIEPHIVQLVVLVAVLTAILAPPYGVYPY